MSKQFFHKDFKLGILGGGQLGRMLIQEAVNFNVFSRVLDPAANAPCQFLASEFEVGSLQDYDTVMAFGRKADVVTIEIEHVNVDALEQLESEGIAVYPQPRVLRMVQDKGLQKNFYRDSGLPTAPYHLVENLEEAKALLSQGPFMQKMRTGGYDGRGVTPFRSEADFDKAFDAPSVLEAFVDLEKEISVIVARNVHGEVKTFPVVELEFNPEANLVEFLFAPATVSEAIESEANALAVQLVEELEFVGLLAVEMFVTQTGEVLINEIAPRPHNSGHHSIEANYTSQYEQHLRAILGMPLGATDTLCPAVMVNLLGHGDYTGDATYTGLEAALQMPGVKLHLYGKKTTKPFRKMGHATILASDLATAKTRAHEVKNTLQVISSAP
ncbi:MAG: 5-(carboxyamino)imidazole ribonucleotide synthase [Salibacteraceae bacterium]